MYSLSVEAMVKKAALLVSFFLGVGIGGVATKLFFCNGSEYRSYQYSDPSFRAVILNALDDEGVMYSYEIDHLKRHWITPSVNDDKFMVSLEAELRSESQKIRQSKGVESIGP